MKVYLVYRYLDDNPDVYADKETADAAIELLTPGWGDPFMEEKKVLTTPNLDNL